MTGASQRASRAVARERQNSNKQSSVYLLGVCDTANFGIDPIPSKYRASIADTDPDPDPNTCNLKIHKFK